MCNDLLDNGEADAGSGLASGNCLPSAVELSENVLDLLLVYSYSLILHGKSEILSVAAGGDGDLSLGR